MENPVNIPTSVTQLTLDIYNHVAVTWNNATVIWGNRPPWGKSVVYHHLRGTWTEQETSGDLPLASGHQFAHVLNDRMFVLTKTRTGILVIHSLDLHTWIWAMFLPSGTPPSVWPSSVGSWAHKEKIYCFGGIGGMGLSPNNELVTYNISANSWEWPDMRGDIPTPRGYPKITISDDTVFLIGGIGVVHDLYNDLFILDMPSMIWRKVHGNLLSGEGPNEAQCWSRTFTKISQTTAVLYGASFDYNTESYLSDCWLLNLHNAKQLMEPSYIWTKIKNLDIRLYHAAILQPLSKRLWVISGYNENFLPSNIMKLNFKQLHSLKDLAMDCVARNICAQDPRLAPEDQIPLQLRNEIEAYRCEIGDQYSCPEDDWRRSACPLEERWKNNSLPLP